MSECCKYEPMGCAKCHQFIWDFFCRSSLRLQHISSFLSIDKFNNKSKWWSVWWWPECWSCFGGGDNGDGGYFSERFVWWKSKQTRCVRCRGSASSKQDDRGSQVTLSMMEFPELWQRLWCDAYNFTLKSYTENHSWNHPWSFNSKLNGLSGALSTLFSVGWKTANFP